MVRIKMPLRLIDGEKHRNSTFMKRRVVIKKKTMELGELCGIVTLLVCFGPRGQVETWPEDPQEVRRIIHHYRSLGSEESIKRRYDIGTFFDAHLKKLRAELTRRRSVWLGDAPEAYLGELARSLDEKLAAVDERIRDLVLGLDDAGGKEITEAPAEGAPPAAQPFSTVLNALPIQSFRCLTDLPAVKQENLHGGYTSAAATTPAAASSRGIPEPPPPPPPLPAPDPYTFPSIPEIGFNMDLSYNLDDCIIPFLYTDFCLPYSAAGACSSSSAAAAPAVDASNQNTPPFPFPFSSYDAPPGCGGIRDDHVPPPFNKPAVDGGYGFLQQLPAGNSSGAMGYNEVGPPNGRYGPAGLFQGNDAGASLAETWGTAMFPELPPSGCSSSDSAQLVAAPGEDDFSRYLPTSASNPYR